MESHRNFSRSAQPVHLREPGRLLLSPKPFALAANIPPGDLRTILTSPSASLHSLQTAWTGNTRLRTVRTAARSLSLAWPCLQATQLPPHASGRHRSVAPA
jgi:hypothetical protein